MEYIQFAKDKPDVVYDYVGEAPQTWAFRWTGIFGQGYYRLTKNGRRHPKGYFKATQQIHREVNNNRCAVKK